MFLKSLKGDLSILRGLISRLDSRVTSLEFKSHPLICEGCGCLVGNAYIGKSEVRTHKVYNPSWTEGIEEEYIHHPVYCLRCKKELKVD